MLKQILLQLTFVACFSFIATAQNTTGSLSGVVRASNNEPLIGATVTAVHEPTGSIYRTQTRTGGRYDMSNMNPGGPYVITTTYVNFTTEEKKDVYLSLGEAFRADFVLKSSAEKLENVTVTASSKKSTTFSGKGGTETFIGRDKVNNIPTVGRNLQDFLRYTPQAKLTAADGGISIAGQNNRYNGFYIDGAVNNDVFGLSNSGTNGGQTSTPPISIDAIDQFQVIVSPYDASIGNFTGGGINATTRSGTNKTQGSVYYFYRNENLAGETPTGPKSAATKLASFDNKTYGFRIGGPIIKNKLFYFFNGELQRDTRPQPFAFSGYRGNSNRDSINKLINYLGTAFGYDPGTFEDNPEQIQSNKIAAKIDWNINANHKLALSYRYNNSERENTSASSSTRVNFSNNGVFFPSITHSASAELKSNFGKNKSNRLLVTFTNVNDDRGTLGSPFPRVTLFDGAGQIILGTENFSNANLLKQQNIGLIDFFKFNKGKHSFTVGTDNELSKSYNVFIRDNYGTYEFTNLTSFLQNQRPSRYTRSFSLVDGGKVTGDNTAAAAEFTTLRLGGFVNDEIKVSDNFTITLGVRADWTTFLTDPKTDQFFNDTALPAISRHYDMQGARSGQISDPKISISPRVGFTWKAPEENVTIRGGLGLFTGRVPLVWPGGVYNQNGVSVGGVDLSGSAVPTNFRFVADPFNQPNAADLGQGINNKGQVDLITKDFRLPKLFRTSLGFDKRIGQGWTLTLEGIFSKNINEIYYQNVNILPPTLKSTGVDVRNVYSASGNPTRIPMRSNGSNPYQGNIFLLSNNKGDKGYSYTFTFTVDKAFRNGFAFNANYSYGQSQVTNEGTSSQNNSQWRFMETVNGRNFVPLSTSDFDLGHRVNAYISKEFTYFKKMMSTTITLTYNGQSGNPFSYTSNRAITGDNGPNETNDLIYVPTAAQIASGAYIFVNNTPVAGGPTFTPAQQQAAFEQYISNDKYLSKRRGQYAERNGARLPFTNILDLSIRQQFNVKVGKQRYGIEVRYDVANFTNMLNRDWGRQYFLSNDSYQLVRFAGFQTGTTTPTFQFDPNNNTRTPWGISSSVVPNYTARWVSQLGFRFNFN
jgi:hypothetical protein